MRIALALALLLSALSSSSPTASAAEPQFRIEAGRNYQDYSHGDLQRRVWELERAVWELQQKVFQLETNANKPKLDTWVCTVSAKGNTYTGVGPTKALANLKAMEACKAANDNSTFFCRDMKCEQ